MNEGFDVGHSFCLNNKQQPESGLFIAYGSYTDEDIEVAHLPSPYHV
jgi:hypothetical protein